MIQGDSHAPRRVMMLLPHPLSAADGGVQRSTLQMGEYFASLGWEVAYVSLSCDGHDERQIVHLYQPGSDLVNGTHSQVIEFLRTVIAEFKPGIVFNQIGVPEQPAKALHQIKTEADHFKVIACFRNSPEFFRSNLANGGYLGRKLGVPATSIPGAKLVDSVVTWAHRRKAARLFEAALDRCDRLMLLSPRYVDDLKWYLPDLDGDRIITIPNAYEQPSQVDWNAKQDHLLYVGRIHHQQKNVMVLPELWKAVHSTCPDWEFHIVGYGPDTVKLKDKFAELGCRDVYFHGRQPASRFFEKARLFVMTSSYEGFPNTLIEAQMHGVVPIAFRSFSAIDEMVNHQKDAILVAPYDVGKMADQIVEMMNDEKRRMKMAQAGRSNARRFSSEAVGEKWQSVLSELMEGDSISS